MKTHSIQRRILASTVILLALVGGVTFGAVSYLGQQAADEAFDRVLGAAALSIADTIDIQEGQVGVDIPYAAFAILGTSRLNRVFYRIAAPDGSLVTGSPILGLDGAPATGPQLRLWDSNYRGTPVRIAAVARYHAGASGVGGGWVDILVGETREARNELGRRLTFNATFPAVAVAVLAFVLIWFAVSRAFVPLRAVETEIRVRASSDLRPIEGNIPREVTALVSALNEFMERLSSTLAGLKRVTADAAHQLRTPLTALRALSEVALDEVDEGGVRQRIERIHANAVHASILANQLLSDATILHRLETQDREPLDLCVLTREVVQRLMASGAPSDAGERITFRLPSHPIIVQGEAMTLREMLRNLVENALMHTQGRVHVDLSVRDGFAQLRVCDRGPGIPTGLREAMFERFVRGDDGQPGSGLGLPIARAVSESHGGSILIVDRDGGGLCFVVRLPVRSLSSNGNATAIVTVFLLTAAIAALPLLPQSATAQSPNTVTIVGVSPVERLKPLLDSLAPSLGGLQQSYVQLRPSQITSGGGTNDFPAPDVVLLPSPDLAIWLANEGTVLRHELSDSAAPPINDWRNEVFSFAVDPAVFVVREGVVSETEVPRDRPALARLLEQNPARFARRVGLVNIGTDSVSYTLAAQDSLRSPLFWRVMRAFGAAEARIYDQPREMLEALSSGAIDIAYNVPLSDARALQSSDSSLTIVVPEDYAIYLPWVAFIPAAAPDPELGGIVLDTLLSNPGRAALIASGIAAPADQWRANNPQYLNLGPELLVYLDPMKRSRFLDTWFQLVTNQ